MAQVSPAQFRAIALDSSRDDDIASILVARFPHGTLPVGLTRNDARKYFDSSLFTGGICTLSVPRGTQPAEVLAVVHQAFGPEVPGMLRQIDRLSASLDYFYVLTDVDGFVPPTLLQDAYLARHCGARTLIPVG